MDAEGGPRGFGPPASLEEQVLLAGAREVEALVGRTPSRALTEEETRAEASPPEAESSLAQ